jgi:hypothetical protein
VESGCSLTLYKKQTPWPESASELYRPRKRRNIMHLPKIFWWRRNAVPPNAFRTRVTWVWRSSRNHYNATFVKRCKNHAPSFSLSVSLLNSNWSFIGEMKLTTRSYWHVKGDDNLISIFHLSSDSMFFVYIKQARWEHRIIIKHWLRYCIS